MLLFEPDHRGVHIQTFRSLFPVLLDGFLDSSFLFIFIEGFCSENDFLTFFMSVLVFYIHVVCF